MLITKKNDFQKDLFNEIVTILGNLNKKFAIDLMTVYFDNKQIKIKMPNTAYTALYSKPEDYNFTIHIYLNETGELCFKYAEYEDNLQGAKEIAISTTVSSKNGEISLEKVIKDHIDNVCKLKKEETNTSEENSEKKE